MSLMTRRRMSHGHLSLYGSCVAVNAMSSKSRRFTDRQTPATCRPAPTFRRDARAVTTRGLLEYCISRGVTFGDQMPVRGRHRERARCRNTDTNVENQTSTASAVLVSLQPSGNESARKIIIIYCNYSYFVLLSSVKFGFLFSFLLSHFVVK